ncbi:hypothetical protein HOP50_01g07330 [Chloropicon primus]|uniref:Sulfotransferase domain-containing protein n=1 Tax=Chloropicon primus TaxID=1764295 RepID=A0A5B8MDB8_9CHLO|nr:hypothetical protein A3770_01p07490 [Chloropicon primus]UPQ97442.1 hypothetical protein HOP50_01g07330 [Chloropicon primus]|eukprot:QDZ18231.1 hypothetical protein A3770_01p07490 [Chloropicon primus]
MGRKASRLLASSSRPLVSSRLVAAAAVFFLVLVVGTTEGTTTTTEECLKRLDDLPNFAEGRLVERGEPSSPPPPNPNFYFFLHIPRVAGRTLNFCLMKGIFPPYQRCLSSYGEGKSGSRTRSVRWRQDGQGDAAASAGASDVRHNPIDVGALDPVGHRCSFQGTHDDLSVLETIRPFGQDDGQNLAVFTQLRDPVDRALSAYEFTVRTASRYLYKPKKTDGRRTSTDDVWPWIELIPIVEEDMRRRKQKTREREKLLVDSEDGAHAWSVQYNATSKDIVYYNRVSNETAGAPPPGANVLPDLDPYDNPLVMPLSEFVRLPEVHHVIHNNQVYQVLGITNISREHGLSKELRGCAMDTSFEGDYAFGEAILDRAKGVLDGMWHVSLFEDLDASIAGLLEAGGWDFNQLAYKNGERWVENLRVAVQKKEEERRERLVELEDDLESLLASKLEQQNRRASEDSSDDLAVKELRDIEREEERLMEELRKAGEPIKAEEAWLSDEYGMPPDKATVKMVYDQCIDRARSKKEMKHKIKFLQKVQDEYGRQIVYKRHLIDEEVIDYIEKANVLDRALYMHARGEEDATCKSVIDTRVE